jgi:hypothetical protein
MMNKEELALILLEASIAEVLTDERLGCSRFKTHQDMIDCSWYIYI